MDETVEVYVAPSPKVTHKYHEEKGFIYGLPARDLTVEDNPNPGLLKNGLDAGVFTPVREKKTEDTK